MRARFEADKRRKLTKRRYGTWAPPKTEVEKDRRYIDLIRQFDEEDPIRGYERYSIYPERLLPPKKSPSKKSSSKKSSSKKSSKRSSKKGGKRSRKTKKKKLNKC